MISSHKRLVAGTSFLLLIFSVLASLFFASHSAHATSAAPSRTVYADYLIRLAGASPDPLTLNRGPGFRALQLRLRGLPQRHPGD
jgi:hypothetical protein